MTRIARILVPTDFSATSDAALAYARVVAERFDASLHLVHVFQDPFTAAAFATGMYSTLPLSLREELLQRSKQRLAERLPATHPSSSNGTAEVVTGVPSTAIVEYARSFGPDLIVMGTHGRGGMAHLLLGSVAERVVRTATCPVMTIREAPAAAVGRILVPTDFSQTADAAIDYAEVLAQRFGASIGLLHVLEDPFIGDGPAAEAYITEAPTMRSAMLQDAQLRLEHRARSLPALVGRVETEVLFGHGARTIAEYAGCRDVDLIVMGTHGRTGVAHALLGSVAERLVRSAPCPVMTVRHVAQPTHHAELTYDVDHLPA